MTMISSTYSLIIPTYNRADLIGATLDAALAQRRPFDEIIVVDDGSTDHTDRVLGAYADRVRVLRPGKGGVQRARNAGVDAATGTHVVLCDSDDLLEPDYLKTMATWMDAHPDVGAAYSNFVAFDARGAGPDKFSQAPDGFFDGAARDGGFLVDVPDLYGRTVAFQPLFPSGSLIRKDVYQRIGGYDPRFNGVGGEDWEFTLRLIGLAKVALCMAPLVRIRKHGGNDSRDALNTVCGCIDIMEYVLLNHPWAAPYRAIIQKDIDKRRLEVFDMAFARGAFELANQTVQQFRETPHGAKFRIKDFIAHQPALVRSPLWRLSQRLG